MVKILPTDTESSELSSVESSTDSSVPPSNGKKHQVAYMAEGAVEEANMADSADEGGPVSFSQSDLFQQISIILIWAGVALHVYEWSRVHVHDNDEARILDICRCSLFLWYGYELYQRLQTWLDPNSVNQYSSDSGLFLDFVVLGAYGLGAFVLPLVDGTFMKWEANMNDVIAFCRLTITFRTTRMPMISSNIFGHLNRIAQSSAATLEVMGWPLIFIFFLSCLYGLALVTLCDLSDNIRPELYDEPLRYYVMMIRKSGTASWYMFRLCLMDKTFAWDLMEGVEPIIMVPFWMSYVVIVRTAVNIMLFMVVLERVDKNMEPIDHAEAEAEHVEAFLEVQSLFTEPADADGYFRVSEPVFFENLPMCPRLMESFDKMGLVPKDLPYIYKILGDGSAITFRHLATDYAKISSITDEAEALAASKMCANASERIWLFTALLDSKRLKRIAESDHTNSSQTPLPDQYKSYNFAELADIARGEAPSKPTALQEMVLNLSYNIMWGVIVLVNLVILYYQYTLPVDKRGDTIWMVLDLAFLGMYTGEALLRIKAWGIHNVLPWNRPWLFLDCMICVIGITFYLIVPVIDGSFLKNDSAHKYGRMFEVLKCLRFMRSTLALRRFDFWNSFVRLNYMFLSNVMVVIQWFIYFTCWAGILGCLWHYFVGTGRFYKVDPQENPDAAAMAMRMNTIYFSTLNILRNTFDGQFVYVPIIEFAPWTFGLYVLTLLAANLIVANMLGGLLFVNIEKNRKGPDLEVNVYKLYHEYTAILRNFGCTATERTIDRQAWLRGASRSRFFVPALMQLHMAPEDIPVMYDHIDIDKSGSINAIEFLVMYRHIKRTASDALTTALIEMARSTAERAMYLLANFDAPPSKDDLGAMGIMDDEGDDM